MCPHVRLTLVVVVFHCFAAHTSGEDVQSKMSLVEKLSVAPEPDLDATKDTLAALFRGSTNDELQELIASEYDSVALFAAWERARQDCELALAENRTRAEDVCQPCIDRFAGLLEGRLAARIPAWWLAHLRSATPALTNEPKSRQGVGRSKRARVLEFDFEQRDDYSSYELIGNDLYVDKSLHQQFIGEDLVLRPNQNEFIVSSSLRKNLGASENIAGALALVGKSLPDGNLVLVAHGAHHGEKGYVLLLEKGTDKVRWKSIVAGDAPGGGTSGGGLYKRETVSCDDTRVIVCGAGAFGMYIETFALRDGTCLVRFFTNGLYSDQHDLPQVPARK